MNPTRKGLAVLAFLLLAAAAYAAPAAPAYRDGSYRAAVSENGLGSLAVLVVVKGGAVASVEFPEGRGDLDLEDAALADYIAALAAAPALMEVDALSGATASCNLLKAAIFEALKAAAP